MPTIKTRQDILLEIKALHEALDVEAEHRINIERTPEYQAARDDLNTIEAVINDLQQEAMATRARMDEMKSVVNDSRPALEEVKQLLIASMRIDGVEGYAEDWISVSGKFSEKRSVDGMRLLETLGGDVDSFVSIVKPTQKAVKAYADELGDPVLRKKLMSCIKLESRELVDVEISLPIAS